LGDKSPDQRLKHASPWFLETRNSIHKKGELYEEPKKTTSVFRAVVCLRDNRDRRRSGTLVRTGTNIYTAMQLAVGD
jgi:hypothetical protein